MVKPDKWKVDKEAIPAFKLVKNEIVQIYFGAAQLQTIYRQSNNPMDLFDFATIILHLYGMIQTDIEADKKLSSKLPNLLGKQPSPGQKKYPGLKEYLIEMPEPDSLDPREWAIYFNEINHALYLLNISRLTRHKDNDDDLDGWE